MSNAYQSDGSLKIVARKETYTDQGVTKEYTSARLNSKFAFKYGRVEFRAKMPSGYGTWPAVWMLGKSISESGTYWANEGYGTTSLPNKYLNKISESVKASTSPLPSISAI